MGDELHLTHRMMMLAIQLGTILLAARLGAVLFERLKLPGVLGELMTGILIGPYLLGALPLPGFRDGLFPVAGEFPVSPELYGLCAIAAVVLLFIVGLETDIKLFLRYSLAGSLVGIGGVVVSFLLGDLTAVAFSRMLFGAHQGFLSPPCLFVGLVCTATSVGISARILSERRKLDSPEGVTIIAGAVVDDVLGIILLAVGLGIVSAFRSTGRFDWGHIGAIAAKAVGIWLAATLIGLLASRRISFLLKWFRDRSAIAIAALGLALILSGLFEKAGLAMIVGAYVMGLSFSATDIAQVIRERLMPVHAFLVPVFFVVMGMLVDVHLLFSRDVLLFGLLFSVVANVAKITGCALPALACNFNLRGALRIGFGMLPRGEVTLIIAGIGLTAGILNAELFGVIIMMIMVTAFVAPPALVHLFSNPASGLRKPGKEDNEYLRFSFPSTEIASLLVEKLLAAFEMEQFFVHSLSRRDRIYQLRKDEKILGFQQKGGEIIFRCGPADSHLVNTAMLEVVAELEQTLEALRKPVDKQAIGKMLQDDRDGSAQKPSLARHLSPATLVPALQARNKPDAIEELLRVLDKTGRVRDLDAAREAVWAREKSMSTGMQYGVALPHCRTEAVDTTLCAVGLSPQGIEFDSIDRKPAHIIVMILTPKGSPAPHVEFLSTISQLLDEDGRRRLLACRSAREMYAALIGDRPART